jgi:hypothetical protein
VFVFCGRGHVAGLGDILLVMIDRVATVRKRTRRDLSQMAVVPAMLLHHLVLVHLIKRASMRC